MMLGPPLSRMTADAFLDWVVDQESHYELVAGQPVMMVGATPRHDRTVINALGEMIAQLRGRTCRPFTSETTIRIPAGHVRFPDLGVGCGAPDDRSLAAAEPRLVVEVSSPGTTLSDRTTKLEGYKAVPGTMHIPRIDPELPQTRLYALVSDGTWRTEIAEAEDAVVALPAIEASLPHRVLYEGITFRHRPTLVG